MAQTFIKDIEQRNQHVVMLDGKYIPYILNTMPKKEDVREANLLQLAMALTNLSLNTLNGSQNKLVLFTKDILKIHTQWNIHASMKINVQDKIPFNYLL